MPTAKASPETERAGLIEFLDFQREALILSTFVLDAPCVWPDMADQNLRFVALHMIEETARHAGHAEIIRETIDGTRGR
jgi:hypothetical protein